MLCLMISGLVRASSQEADAFEARRRPSSGASVFPKGCRRWVNKLSVLAIVGALLFTPSAAHAVGSEEPRAIGKGVFGGALLGAELTLVVEAAFGVEPFWAYALGGGLGAIGGGIGGFFLADATGPEVPSALLMSSLVLAVPATIIVLSQTVYRTPPDLRTDSGASTAMVYPRSVYHVLPAARVPSLVQTNERGRLALGAPGVSVTATTAGRIFGSEVSLADLGWATKATTDTRLLVPLVDLQFQ